MDEIDRGESGFQFADGMSATTALVDGGRDRRQPGERALPPGFSGRSEGERHASTCRRQTLFSPPMIDHDPMTAPDSEDTADDQDQDQEEVDGFEPVPAEVVLEQNQTADEL